MRWIISCLGLLIAGVMSPGALGSSVPFWGAKDSVPVGTPISQLTRGEFLWIGDAVTAGPIVMIVSITEQKAFVYRNGILIGATTVSTGRPGHPTPTGVFTVLQKQKEHRSTIYDGAPMPYMERLTWGGVALHAGGLPGYPESHGCVHLPSEFARRLFGISPTGMTVVIASDATAPEPVAHPGYLAPVSVIGGKPIDRMPLAPTEIERWQPELSPSGPVSIVLSRASQRVVVYRNGIQIGKARIQVSGDAPFPTHALVLTEGPSPVTDPYVPDPAKYHWLRVALPGDSDGAGKDADPAIIARIKIPEDFVRKVNSILTAGAIVIVRDRPLSPSTSAPPIQVVDADPPAEAHRG